MTEAYIIDAVRTPRGVGKPGKGALSHLHPQHLAATVLKALKERTGGISGYLRSNPCSHIPAVTLVTAFKDTSFNRVFCNARFVPRRYRSIISRI